jgi:5-methyltetrahydrofolate--homocysteine methyltransferase
METLIKEIYTAVMEGEKEVVFEKVQAAMNAGVPAQTVLNDGMIAAMSEVGRLFEDGEYFIPEMLIAAHAMKAGLALLKPALKEAGAKSAGRVAIGTVQGDMHDIGKNLVAMMLEGAGFEIIDLGIDVAPEKFVESAREQNVQIIAMSALLTTTMPAIETTIKALSASGLHRRVKVMIGGAPITQDYANLVGADGFSPDASRAVATARALISG